MLNISTRENEWDAVLATEERNADIWATVGIHPHEADAHPEVDTAKLKARAGHPMIVGIGETGLDYYYDHSDREQQKRSFRAHIAARSEEHNSELTSLMRSTYVVYSWQKTENKT